MKSFADDSGDRPNDLDGGGGGGGGGGVVTLRYATLRYVV